MSLSIDLIEDEKSVFYLNITHNLLDMATAAGLQATIWEPEVLGFVRAEELVYRLNVGLAVLKDDPERFEKLNPKNGWGSYEDFVNQVESYLEACNKFPKAEISTSK